jgi:CHAT domain-containing protein
MPTTPGYESLPSANNEAYCIKKVIKRWSIKRKAQIAIEGSITVQKLGAELPNQTIVHLICHAVTEGDASKSRLLLWDGHLTVAQIARMKLKHASLAYLSACSSAYSPDTLLDDESITLASAFQVAGYPRVLGSLWNTVDDIACAFASTFYETLQNDLTKSAESLHRAILNQRILTPNEPSLWAAFICVGD